MLKLLIRLAYIAIMFIEALVITRIILIIINASTENQFANWVMSISDILIQPFDGIVASTLQINNFSLPLTPIIALLFYIVAAFVLSELQKAFSRE